VVQLLNRPCGGLSKINHPLVPSPSPTIGRLSETPSLPSTSTPLILPLQLGPLASPPLTPHPPKEVIKEQSTPANLSATARRVLRCTRSQKPSCSFKEIFFGYFHRTVPETPSQIGFKSVKQKVENYTLGHFKIQNGGF